MRETVVSSNWHCKLNIVLPWHVATAEVPLERNQNPNRSGKSLVLRASGRQFLFVFVLELCFFQPLAHFLLSVL